MAQTSVADEPVQTYEGKVENSVGLPTTIVSGIASELIYFGKFVVAADPTDVAYGGAGQQEVALPGSAAEITGLTAIAGVAIADVSREAIAGAAYGGYTHESSVGILRKGRIWVVVSTAITDLTDGVYVRWQVPGTPPVDSLGSFDSAAGANVQEVTAGMSWAGAVTIGSTDYGLLDVNLPA
jgi:expansin (peptidoglycan-binding protein)